MMLSDESDGFAEGRFGLWRRHRADLRPQRVTALLPDVQRLRAIALCRERAHEHAVARLVKRVQRHHLPRQSLRLHGITARELGLRATCRASGRTAPRGASAFSPASHASGIPSPQMASARRDDNDLVHKAYAHLKQCHPGLNLSREQVLALATNE